MRWLFTALLILLIAVGTTLLLHRYPGTITLELGAWLIETSAVVAAIGLLVLFFLVHFLLRLVGALLRTPRAWREAFRDRRAEKSRRNLTRGLIEMAEGRWESAEKLLVRDAEQCDTGLLNYLAAARAAQQVSAYDRRDRYLKLAIERNPEADIAVSLTQAELQLSVHQTEHALASLTRLRGLAPGHTYVMKLLSRLYIELEDWDNLAALLPELKRRKVVTGQALQRLERRIALGCIGKAANDVDSLGRLWERFGRTTRENPDVLLAYARRITDAGNPVEAAKLVRSHLNRHWNETLAREFGLIPLPDAARQLDQAEAWLAHHGRSPMLLLSLGRLCVRCQLWGKARAFLESSLSIEARVETHYELAELLEHLGEHGAAREHARAGLLLAVQADGVAASTPRPSVATPKPRPDPVTAQYMAP